MTDPLEPRDLSHHAPAPKPLSTAAQAVMIAATNGNTNVVNDPVYRQCIAAALRAAAEQVRTDRNLKRHYTVTVAEKLVLDRLLAIVAELGGHHG